MNERNFSDILNDLAASPDLTTHLTPDWQQGRAAFGGIAAAMAVTGMLRPVGNEKPLRSLMVSFAAPVPAGEITVAPRVVREGKSVTQASAEVLAGGTVCVQALAAFGLPRPGITVPPCATFDPEPRDSVPAMPKGVPGLPKFLNHFDIHWVGGGIPASNRKDRHLTKWVRHSDRGTDHRTARLVAIADIPPPVIMSHYDRPIMASSLSWALEFVVPPETLTSEWFYLDYMVEAATDGYSQQTGHIFDETGQLVALSSQCMVYFE